MPSTPFPACTWGTGASTVCIHQLTDQPLFSWPWLQATLPQCPCPGMPLAWDSLTVAYHPKKYQGGHAESRGLRMKPLQPRFQIPAPNFQSLVASNTVNPPPETTPP
ncbi:hypothetical protein EYR41_007113 [Orbilia oligospora]|uniref:Uncharacterized protein n=1 Tax=Orbilia oligospora TaxID=2813651 RepID=A0A8H2DYF3_ORBOL|nr:hypothetical protein EYR41_007113 [Orbilia oligospora]